MEWLPFESVGVDSIAFPPLSVRVPNVLVPFLNVTLPPGVPVNAGFTVAVKATD